MWINNFKEETMLIEKSNDVTTFKLINGDEILGRKDNKKSTAEIVVISKPMKFMITPQGPGLISPVFTANMTTSEMSVRADHIIFNTTTDPEVATDYIRQTSKLTTPPTPNILVP